MEVILGTIVATFGIKGEVKVHSNTDFAKHRYKKGNKVIVCSPINGSKEELVISSYKQSRGLDIISFENLTNPDMVIKYKGYKILVEKQDEYLGKDVYHYADIFNCEVYHDNEKVGVVIDMFDSGSHLTLRIKREGKKDVLYPFVDKFISIVDVNNKRIDINPIKGMIDLWK